MVEGLAVGDSALAQTPGGVVVPARLANMNNQGTGVARDMDGRRRLVYTDDQRRQIHRTQGILRSQGVGSLVGCIGAFGPPAAAGETRKGGTGYHLDGSKACGEVMKAEGLEELDGRDAGYGCKCTRIHFLRT